VSLSQTDGGVQTGLRRPHLRRPRLQRPKGPLSEVLACANGDDTAYRDYRDRYRDMAKTLGFDGHIAWAEAMP
jgi:hypothetical protein